MVLISTISIQLLVLALSSNAIPIRFGLNWGRSANDEISSGPGVGGGPILVDTSGSSYHQPEDEDSIIITRHPQRSVFTPTEKPGVLGYFGRYLKKLFLEEETPTIKIFSGNRSPHVIIRPTVNTPIHNNGFYSPKSVIKITAGNHQSNSPLIHQSISANEEEEYDIDDYDNYKSKSVFKTGQNNQYNSPPIIRPATNTAPVTHKHKHTESYSPPSGFRSHSENQEYDEYDDDKSRSVIRISENSSPPIIRPATNTQTTNSDKRLRSVIRISTNDDLASPPIIRPATNTQTSNLHNDERLRSVIRISSEDDLTSTPIIRPATNTQTTPRLNDDRLRSVIRISADDDLASPPIIRPATNTQTVIRNGDERSVIRISSKDFNNNHQSATINTSQNSFPRITATENADYNTSVDFIRRNIKA